MTILPQIPEKWMSITAGTPSQFRRLGDARDGYTGFEIQYSEMYDSGYKCIALQDGYSPPCNPANSQPGPLELQAIYIEPLKLPNFSRERF
jgi:hypothetical protein